MALGQRTIEQRLVVERQQVEGDERRRRLGGEPAHARLGRVDALQQRVEVETAIVRGRHDDLAVDDAALRQRREQRVEQLGEVAGERPLVAAGELDRRRRRGTRCSGTRPTSARTASRHPWGCRSANLASIGDSGG